jgi:hypothetical protein
MYVMYYTLMLWCWQLVWMLVKTTILFMGGMSQLVSEPYEYNTSLTDIFLKTYGEDMPQCPYKDYSSLDRWPANRDLLSIFTFCNLLFVTTHLRQGKKVSILLPDAVNPGPVSSRQSLLEGNPYCAVGAAVCRATSHDHIPRASRDLRMSCGYFHKT